MMRYDKASCILFVIITLCILVYPLLHIDPAFLNQDEQRVMADKPSFFLPDGNFNLKYGVQFESWLGDRFNGRDQLCSLSHFIDTLLKQRAENARVFSGAEDWLFLKDLDSIDLYRNKKQFTDGELKEILAKQKERKEFLDSLNAKYYMFLIPNKEDVYDEYYPAIYTKVEQNSWVDNFISYFKINLPELPIIYVLDDLKKGKQKDNYIYWKNDSHWNTSGAYIGYQRLMQEIKKDFPEVELVKPQKIDWRNHEDGDLSRILKISWHNAYKEQLYPELIIPKNYHCVLTNTNIGGRIKTVNPQKKLKVLVFRDSFTVHLSPYLSETFGEVEYIWSFDFEQYKKEILAEKPDIVIVEMVSRMGYFFLPRT